MSDALSGVFLCSGFTARCSDATVAFCKPVNIRIYSAPPPVRMRVITYEIRFVEGEEQPSTATAWQEQAKAYQSPFNGERSFSFTVGTLEIDQTSLFTQIRRHFYAVVLKGEVCRSRTHGFERLMGLNTATRRYTVDEDTALVVYDVYHVRGIDIDETWHHQEVKADVRYRANLLDNRGGPLYVMDYRDRYISTPHQYHDGRALLGIAVDHFKNPAVQEQVINSAAVSE